MKKSMYVLGVTAASLVFVSSFLKISNITIAEFILILGFATLALGFIPLLFYIKYLENKRKGYLAFYIAGFASAFMLSLAGLVNALNHDLGNTLTIVAVLMLYIVFLPLYAFYIYHSSKNKVTNFTVIIAIIIISSFITFSSSNNINKSILDAFAFTTSSIEENTEYLTTMNQMHYEYLNDIHPTPQNKDIIDFAIGLQQRTNRIIQITDSLKKEMVLRSSGKPEIKNNAIFIEQKENTAIPDKVLLKENGSLMLKDKIIELKGFILQISEDENARIFVDECLSTNDSRAMTWEQRKFEFMPLLAAYKELTIVEQQIIIAEHYVLENIVTPGLE